MRSWLRTAPLLLLVALSACNRSRGPTYSWKVVPRQTAPAPQVVQAEGPAIGSPAPETEGEDIDGRRFKLADYRGKVVVLTFWGQW